MKIQTHRVTVVHNKHIWLLGQSSLKLAVRRFRCFVKVHQLRYYAYSLVYLISPLNETNIRFSLESHDIGNGGKISTDMYCEFPQKMLYKNAYFGDETGDCNKEKSDYVIEETIHASNNCIVIGATMSIQYECIPGSCPDDDVSLIVDDVQQYFSEAHFKTLLA